MGIDYGSKRVGIALSDEALTMGFPHSVLPNDARLMGAIQSLIATEGVDAVVIGESRTLSGTHNPIAKKAEVFAQELHIESGVTVFFEPELFSTQEARRDYEGVWSGKRAGTLDASAAAIILTSYLSHHGKH